MVNLSMTCFAIPRAVVASFDTMTIEIIVVGENTQDPYQDGHGVCIFVESEHTCPTTQKHFQSKDMTWDFACSLTIRSIQRALTRLWEVHHLKMASLLKSLKQHAIKVFKQDSICTLVPSCCGFISSFLVLILSHWAYLESYLSRHVIKFTFTAALPRDEANLKVHFKGSLESLREMQAS